MEQNTFNTFNLIVSIMALGSALYVGYAQRNSDKRINELEIEKDKNINKTQLEAVFFEKIFFELLIYDLPNARREISFESGSGLLKHGDSLIKVLRNIVRNSIYFMYTNEDFYDDLKKIIEELEDYLITNIEKTRYEGKYQKECLEKIDNNIKEIYKLIYVTYTNTK